APKPEEEVDEAGVIAAVKTALGERVSDVRASQRLTDSAACLVAGGAGPDRELERLFARHKGAPRPQALPRFKTGHSPATAPRHSGGGRGTPPTSPRCGSRKGAFSTARGRRIPPRLRAGSTGWWFEGWRRRSAPSLRGAKRRSNPGIQSPALDCFGPAGLAM